MAIGGLIAGALLGTISTTGSAYLFGANIWASVLTGASLGYSFATAKVKGMASPTYSLNEISNTKTQLLPIPIVYGRARIAGNIFYVKYHDSHKQKADEYIAISEGPIRSISQIKAGDQLITDLSKCSVSIHLDSDGSTSDPRDPAGNGDPRPYPDNLAFIAATLKAQEKYNGNEAITSIVEGRLVRTPGGVVYTRNPAWIVRDLLTDKHYGFGFPETVIDDDSFREVAAYCDGAPDNGTAPRFTLDYVIDEKDKGIDILKKMLSCFRGYIVCRDRVELHVEKPSSIINQTVGMGDIVEGSFKWWQSGHDDILNRVIIEWIDPDNSWERTTTIFEDAGDIEKRGIVEKTFSLLGITRADQAARMGAYLLDTSQAVTDFCSFNVGLKKADVEEGDIISLTYDLPGWTGKLMRVTAVKDGENNSIELTCAEYVEEVYNDRAMDFQRHIDTNLDNPWTCPDVTDLAAEEKLALQSDGTLLSNVNLTWTDPDVVLSSVEILMKEEGEGSFNGLGAGAPGVESYTVRGVKYGQTVTIKIRCRNNLGVVSNGSEISLYLRGKDIPPDDVTGLEEEVDPLDRGHVTLFWDELSMDNVPDLRGYVVREGESWDDGTQIGNTLSVSTLSLEYMESGTYRYFVKAVDTSGNLSRNAAGIEVTVSLEPDTPAGLVLVQDLTDRTWGTLSWTASEGKDISGYEIREGSSWENGTNIGFSSSISFRIRLVSSGYMNIMVKAKTVREVFSSSAGQLYTAVSIEPSDIANFTAEQRSDSKNVVILSWDAPEDLDVASYRIKEGPSWDDGVVVGSNVTGLFAELRISEERTYRWWIAAVSVAGKISRNPVSVPLTVALNPTPPSELEVVQDGYDRTKVSISWTASPDPDVTGYEVRDGSIWDNADILGNTVDTRLSLTLSGSHEFEIKVRAKNTSGFLSDEISTFLEADVEPANVTGFQAVQDGDTIDMIWDGNIESDVTGYEIREGQSWTSGTVWATGITQTSYSRTVGTERTYRFHVKAVTRSGFYSDTAASDSVVVMDLPPKNVIAEWDELTEKLGTFDGTEIGESSVTFQTIGGQMSDYADVRFDETGGNTVLKLEKAGTGSYTASGTYSTPIRILSAGDPVTLNLGAEFIPSVVAASGTSAKLEYRTSRDGNKWSEWRLFSPVRKTITKVQWKVTLATEDVTKTPEVVVLTLFADLPDVTKSGRSAVATGGAVIDYGFTFFAVPTLVVSADGASKRAEITDGPEKGHATVKVVDFSGNDVGGTVNWYAAGY